MNFEYHEALSNYYELKRKYDKREQRRRLKGLDTLNQCIKCKKKGGTIFSMKKNIIKAECGATVKCKLNIEIELAKYKNILDEIDGVEKHLENLKQDIIQTKLNVIFNFNNDNKFNELKKTFETQEKYLIKLKQSLDESKKETEGREALYNFIVEYKTIIKDYTVNQNTKLLSDALDLYIEKIIPVQERIREETYTTMSIEQMQNKKFVLTQEKDSHKDLLVKKGRVVSNIT